MQVVVALSSGLQIESFQNAVGEMRLKWLQYYKVIPDTFLVAMVFDPRCKLKGLESFLLAYFPLLGVGDDPQCNVTRIVDRIRGLIQELYIHYRGADAATSSSPLPPHPSPTSSGSSKTSISSRAKSLARDIFGTKRARTASSTNDEVEEYYETTFDGTDMDDDDFDVLAWWSRPERVRFQTLRKIAAQILAVPSSTVAVEQTFSQSGQILDERRSRLLPETLEV